MHCAFLNGIGLLLVDKETLVSQLRISSACRGRLVGVSKCSTPDKELLIATSRYSRSRFRCWLNARSDDFEPGKCQSAACRSASTFFCTFRVLTDHSRNTRPQHPASPMLNFSRQLLSAVDTSASSPTWFNPPIASRYVGSSRWHSPLRIRYISCVPMMNSPPYHRGNAARAPSLPSLLKELGVRVVLDAPCGDFLWMQRVSMDGIEYIGVDIAKSVIEKNIERYQNAPLRRFMHADITQADLPKSDIVLCRDCFIHLSFRDIAAAIRNFQRSGSVYLLTTTYPLQKINWDIHTGAFRPITLIEEPFGFPPPITLIREDTPSGASEGQPSFTRVLGLWKLESLQETNFLRTYTK